MLTWRCFSAETQLSPLEAIEAESEELCLGSRDAPLQVKEPEVEEGSYFQCCPIDLGSSGLGQHCPLGSWELGLLLLGSSQTLPSAFVHCFITPVPFVLELCAAASGAFQSCSWRAVTSSSFFYTTHTAVLEDVISVDSSAVTCPCSEV